MHATTAGYCCDSLVSYLGKIGVCLPSLEACMAPSDIMKISVY